MNLARDLHRATVWGRERKRQLVFSGAALAAAVLAAFAANAESSRVLIRTEGTPDFKNASILGDPGQRVLQGEQTLFNRQEKKILDSQKQLQDEVSSLKSQISQIQPGSMSPVVGPSPVPTPSPALPPPPAGGARQVRLSSPPDDFRATRMGFGLSGNSKAHGTPGRNILAFPVKSTGAAFKSPTVALPSGSYVKAKLLTGVEAPQGKTYPTLLQLDYAYIIPNHKRLDLTGCFSIAKAQGDLSTERVQMQAVKLSCVSEKGGFFEREINGFVADDVDNSFAVMGSVNTKQDRVASVAFLSGIVSGISQAIQQAQTTQQITPLGGGQSMITGDQAKYIGAGGATNAATMVTQWYLQQAQNLLPTINVGSGQDVWIVMQDSVELPQGYFIQNGDEGVEHASIYSYFTRILE